jgi:hypothetical protein
LPSDGSFFRGLVEYAAKLSAMGVVDVDEAPIKFLDIYMFAVPGGRELAIGARNGAASSIRRTQRLVGISSRRAILPVRITRVAASGRKCFAMPYQL